MQASVHLKAFTSAEKKSWDQDVVRMRGCCFHSFDWILYSSEKNNSQPIYFRWYDYVGSLIGIGSGFLLTKTIAGIPVFKTLGFGSFPAGVDIGIIPGMILELINYCQQNKVSYLSMNSFGTPFGTEILQSLDFSVTRRWEFLIDIDTSEDDLWKKIHSKKRNLIRKGQKSNLHVERVTDIDQVMHYHELSLAMQKRKEEKGISLPAGEKSHYKHMKTNLIDLGLARLYLAYDDAQPVAGAFFVGYNKSVYYMLSAANESGLSKAAPDLILWAAITDYQKEGYMIFNLGGVSEGDLNGQPLEKSGLYHFKKRFSAEAHICYKGSLILNPGTYKVYNYLKAVRDKLK